jgi:hypothetical protein
MRKAEFKEGKFRNDEPGRLDSRFGIRPKYASPNETPSIFSYANPGRGVSGEHQN